VSPLGAGALAGSSLPLDPVGTAARPRLRRGVRQLARRGERPRLRRRALFALALLGVHLSRIGEEVCLWASDEFGFLGLDDAYSTGSSMMPQKKNPDIAELARGRSGRLIGHLTGLLTTLKGLPLTYNRDLQEDKEPLFDAVDQVRSPSWPSAACSPPPLPHRRHGRRADSPYAAATDLAELLVERGTPFRDAHAIVGEIVRRALAGEAPWSSWSLPTNGWELRRSPARAGRLGHPPHHARRVPGPAPVADADGALPRPLAADAERVRRG
jgi:argininosuccinate lyase